MAVPTIQITGQVLSPDGAPLTSGLIEAELSQPGSALDAATSQRIVGKVTAAITAGAIGSDFLLVPNDVITPAGTYYRVRISGVTADGLVYRSAVHEKWQLPSSPPSIDIGAVTRIEGSPLALYGPDQQTLAARDAAVAAADRIIGQSDSGIWVGDSPPSTPITYAQWQSGVAGYWAWLDTSTAGVSLTVPALDCSAEAVVPTLAQLAMLLNGGYETQGAGGAADADGWVRTVTSDATLTRTGTDGGVTPHGGSWMMKHVHTTTGITTLNREDLSGDSYRAAGGDFKLWLYTLTTLTTTDATRALYVQFIAHDAAHTELARVTFTVAGNATVSGTSTAQRITLTSGAWTEVTIDIRTTLDAALGADLANVDHVWVLVRTAGSAAFTYYSDDLVWQ